MNSASGWTPARRAPPLLDSIDPSMFWSPASQETLIFNHFVGGACLFSFSGGCSEILRVNAKYAEEPGMNLADTDIIHANVLDMLGETGRTAMLEAIAEAARTGGEQECETWRSLKSACCGSERICIRTALRLVGRSGDLMLFYARIRNITSEKARLQNVLDVEHRFRMASEQVNIYFWEYTVATHEMRPCFRCMRDLGLSPVMRNYPESAIEMGIFPPEVADMYRDWHRRIDAGEPRLEAVIPLTVGRIPFHVRYTTEFDAQGRPVKAYGSAALVVDGPHEGAAGEETQDAAENNGPR